MCYTKLYIRCYIGIFKVYIVILQSQYVLCLTVACDITVYRPGYICLSKDYT